jgi:hypothetical protein
MGSGLVNETPIQIDSYPTVVEFGQASQISPWAAAGIKHGRRRAESSGKRGERTGDRHRAKGGESIRVG